MQLSPCWHQTFDLKQTANLLPPKVIICRSISFLSDSPKHFTSHHSSLFTPTRFCLLFNLPLPEGQTGTAWEAWQPEISFSFYPVKYSVSHYSSSALSFPPSRFVLQRVKRKPAVLQCGLVHFSSLPWHSSSSALLSSKIRQHVTS
jgi:hypothetical protein